MFLKFHIILSKTLNGGHLIYKIQDMEEVLFKKVLGVWESLIQVHLLWLYLIKILHSYPSHSRVHILVWNVNQLFVASLDNVLIR
jgi:hypothetical protein